MFATGPQNHCNFFAKNSTQKGIDLRAYDIAYGHGVNEPTFCSVLNIFNKTPKDCLAAVQANMDGGKMQAMANKYGGSVANIGLTMGLDLENFAGLVGGLTMKIISEQFQRSICGDRFWYNHSSNSLFTQSMKF